MISGSCVWLTRIFLINLKIFHYCQGEEQRLTYPFTGNVSRHSFPVLTRRRAVGVVARLRHFVPRTTLLVLRDQVIYEYSNKIEAVIIRSLILNSC